MNKLSILKVIFILPVLLGAAYAARDVHRNHQRLELKRIELKSADLQLKELEMQYDQALKDLSHSKQTEKTLHNMSSRLEKLENEKVDLQHQLQAKAAHNRAIVYAAGLDETCYNILNQAGVRDLVSAATLIRNESHCNPYATNSSSGACGIAQEWPCGKSGCSSGDGVCQVKWMDHYTARVYGGWDNALAAWYSRCGSAKGCWY